MVMLPELVAGVFYEMGQAKGSDCSMAVLHTASPLHADLALKSTPAAQPLAARRAPCPWMTPLPAP